MELKIKIANQVFSEVNKELSKKYKGKMMAIDTDTKEYFIGDSALDAYEKAIKKYPNKQFVFKRIGFKTAYFAGVLSTEANFSLAGMELFGDCKILIERNKDIIEITKSE